MTGFRQVTAVLAFASPIVVYGLYQNGSTVSPCGSPLYCQGDVLKQIELAQPFSDSKTFVDLPTKAPLDDVLAAFNKLAQPLSNNTELNSFLSTYFGDAGSELAQVPRDQLETKPIFLDKIDDSVIKQFVQKVIDIWPDLTRTYYLNRSQPPLLTQMVKIYVDYTNDTNLVERALPLLIKEHDFWIKNRTTPIRSGNKTFYLARYGVQNTEPRPESYREDYITANNKSYYSSSGIIYPETHALNESEKAELYANLASGAESGWDYNSRWISTPSDAARDVYFPLRSLNTANVIGVDLNSILYANEITIANYLNATGNHSLAAEFEEMAKNRSTAMYSLMWNDKYMSYFDYNLTSESQNIYVPSDSDTTPAQEADSPQGYQVFFHIAQFYPFWLGAAPAQLRDNPLAVKLVFQRVSDLLSEKAGAVAATNYMTGQQWDQPNVWPPLQYILMKGLIETPATFGQDDPSYIAIQDLSLKLAQRYLDSTFYADNSTNVAGGGGEYEVVEGFGWTNGVLIWAVDTFAGKLERPDCGNLTAANTSQQDMKRYITSRRAVELPLQDARRIIKFRKTS
ncbi:hypothetical protein ABKA04_010118 [Annulohypoxylon sp. FPYF3050]